MHRRRAFQSLFILAMMIPWFPTEGLSVSQFFVFTFYVLNNNLVAIQVCLCYFCLYTISMYLRQNTTFGGIQGFTRVPSTPWVDDAGNFAGIVHQERGWSYVLFVGTGHLVPFKKPASASCNYAGVEITLTYCRRLPSCENSSLAITKLALYPTHLV
jgi:hypothetical protein